MKKILVGILTIVYMAASSGIAMEIHYCMGKKAGMDFFGANNKKCGKCGMTEKKGGCCNDEHKFVKLEDSHKNVYNTIDFATAEKVIVTAYPLYNWQLPNNIDVAVVNNHSPPPNYTGPGACIMNCVFRI
jgi:hypothetical protein